MSANPIEILLVEQIDAAPEPLRSYICELERPCDPAKTVRELVYARQEKKALGNAISELKDAIRKHRAEVGELCRKEDRELYRILDEG
jgi:hypothetical protein